MVKRKAERAGSTPLHSVEVEQVIIGAMLLDRDGFNVGMELLSAEVFFSPLHRDVFAAMRMDNDEFGKTDLRICFQRMRKLYGAKYNPFELNDLANGVASAANIELWIREVQELYISRQMLAVCYEFQQKLSTGGEDVFEVQAKLISEVESITNSVIKSKEKSTRILAYEALKELQELQREKRQGLTGIPSGFKQLDQLTGGWQPSNLIILAARPAVGKTAFVLNLARNAAVGYNIPVAIFSLEMSGIELVKRMFSSEALVRGERIIHARLDDSDWSKINSNLGKLEKAPLYIDDSGGLKLHELRAKARRMKAAYGIQMIVIDYLQLMEVEGNAFDGNRVQEISKISRGLKLLAKELKIPVIALSQLSREVDKRTSARPRLSDLRESGSIEQDADIVMFIWSDIKNEDHRSAETFIQEVRHIDFAKVRNGAVGQCELTFTPSFSLFTGREVAVPKLDDDVRFTYDSMSLKEQPPF